MGSRRLRRVLGVAALIGILSGCGAVQHLSGNGPVGLEAPAPYGGVRTLFSSDSLTGSFYECVASMNLRFNEPEAVAVLFAPFVADLGLSFVIDTLLLPVALIRAD